MASSTVTISALVMPGFRIWLWCKLCQRREISNAEFQTAFRLYTRWRIGSGPWRTFDLEDCNGLG